MYRLRPDYRMYARPISEYPGKGTSQRIMLMIQNNLELLYAQHPRRINNLWW